MTDTDTAVAALGDGFVSETLEVNATTLHVVHGGQGPAAVLLHGFPQDWYEWRAVMPALAESFTVVAVDLRGVGGSAPTDAGYDAATLADDVRGVVDALRLGPVHVVGHDIGGWVAYAFARRHVDVTATATVIETPIPGVAPWPDFDVDVPLWHGEFHMIPDLPETLVAGREAAYFRYFFDVGTVADGVIGADDLDHYVRAYGDRARLRSAFEFYRALPRTVEFLAAQRDPVEVPLLLVGGDQVFGATLSSQAGPLAREHGWADVRVEVLDDARHYVVEERPGDIVELVRRHARPAG